MKLTSYLRNTLAAALKGLLGTKIKKDSKERGVKECYQQLEKALQSYEAKHGG